MGDLVLPRIIRWDAIRPTEILWAERTTEALWVGTLVDHGESMQRWLEIEVTDEDWRQVLHSEISLRTLFGRAKRAQMSLRNASLGLVSSETTSTKIPAKWLPVEKEGETEP